ncbi:hypothetical protein HII31_08269 [Pseudocercospora fuligena]|uniref:Uncharacterized protein n=1 Tax=Pseudocercospora fuligena TaxID=685502 RepID=A0A8H6RD46_9PEZI|nr:hypothetical protein HII31_08269 [Pseudocercospora fuligena]
MFPTTESQRILNSLPLHHDGKIGFVVYRVAYGDDERWAQFLKHLDAHVQAGCEGDKHSSKLKEAFEWDIRQDEAKLKDASKNEIRRMFKEWIRSVKGSGKLARYQVCIYADDEVINSVIEDESPGDEDYELVDRPRAFVKLLHRSFEETPHQFTPQQVPDAEERERMSAGDEGYPPIEGCKRRDVGWMKSSIKWLVPVTYAYMEGGGWDLLYTRPPKMSAGGG